MNTKTRTTLLCLAAACVGTAATKPALQKRLTPQRLAELTAPAEAPKARAYSVVISGLEMPGPNQGFAAQVDLEKGPARITVPADKPEAVLEVIREFRYPIEFDPPQAAPDTNAGITPMKPTAFGTINTGWTVRLSVKPSGKLVALSGMADYTEAQLMNGGYGAVAGPIYSEQGKLISPNVIHQPKVKTTSTGFHLFAVPGEPYEVRLYQGDKARKYTIKVNVE